MGYVGSFIGIRHVIQMSDAMTLIRAIAPSIMNVSRHAGHTGSFEWPYVINIAYIGSFI